MTAIQIQVQMSSQELLRGVAQLNSAELESFVQQVIALSAQRKAPNLPKQEADLLLKINQRLPNETQQRYDKLVSKRKAETLKHNEHQELLELLEQVEQFDAERVQNLAALAKLRGFSLATLMENLGAETPAYA